MDIQRGIQHIRSSFDGARGRAKIQTVNNRLLRDALVHLYEISAFVGVVLDEGSNDNGQDLAVGIFFSLLLSKPSPTVISGGANESSLSV
jgi:hypothetical protein